MPSLLLVDDDAGFVETCAIALRREAYEVTSAGSVQQALLTLSNNIPDAVLLDWRLPDGTGLHVAEWMRARGLDVPIALITGFWADPLFERIATDARRLGISEVLRRGVDIDDPCDLAARLLDPMARLHAQVCQDDSEATDRVVGLLAKELLSMLRARFHRTPQETISDAVTDALLEYFAKPERFQLGRGVPLKRFLYRASRANLINALRSERRRLLRDTEFAASPLPASEQEHPGAALIASALEREHDPEIRAALRRWLDGDRSLAPWASVLRFRGLSDPMFRREVKRAKDTFIARCRRAGRC